MAGGRPLKFATVELLDTKIKAYFDECKLQNKTPTISALAVYLDTSRETLLDYKEKPEYSDSIKKAKDMCLMNIEQGALENKLNTAFSIFNLKNNYGWVDKQEIDQNVNMTAKIDLRTASDEELEALIK